MTVLAHPGGRRRWADVQRWSGTRHSLRRERLYTLGAFSNHLLRFNGWTGDQDGTWWHCQQATVLSRLSLPSVEKRALPTIGRRWLVLSPPPPETLAEFSSLGYRAD